LDWLLPIRIFVPAVLLGVALGRIVSRKPYYLERLLPSFWWPLAKKTKKRRILEFVAFSAVFATALFFLSGWVTAYLEKHVPPEELERYREEYPLTLEKIPALILFPLVNLFAFLEEWLFRGILLEEFSISLRSRVGGLVASSLVFGIFHLSNPGIYLALVLPLTLAGLFLGVVYLFRGLTCSILTHCFYNSLVLTIQLIAPTLSPGAWSLLEGWKANLRFPRP
jgi:membrane protease YdiL (CAAX protease family)